MKACQSIHKRNHWHRYLYTRHKWTWTSKSLEMSLHGFTMKWVQRTSVLDHVSKHESTLWHTQSVCFFFYMGWTGGEIKCLSMGKGPVIWHPVSQGRLGFCCLLDRGVMSPCSFSIMVTHKKKKKNMKNFFFLHWSYCNVLSSSSSTQVYGSWTWLKKHTSL